MPPDKLFTNNLLSLVPRILSYARFSGLYSVMLWSTIELVQTSSAQWKAIHVMHHTNTLSLIPRLTLSLIPRLTLSLIPRLLPVFLGKSLGTQVTLMSLTPTHSHAHTHTYTQVRTYSAVVVVVAGSVRMMMTSLQSWSKTSQ